MRELNCLHGTRTRRLAGEHLCVGQRFMALTLVLSPTLTLTLTLILTLTLSLTLTPTLTLTLTLTLVMLRWHAALSSTRSLLQDAG